MRSSGLSMLPARRARGAARALVIALLTLAVGEFVTPYTEEAAKSLRLKATSSIVAREFRSGFWVKDDRSFVNIQDVTADTELLNLKHLRIRHGVPPDLDQPRGEGDLRRGRTAGRSPTWRSRASTATGRSCERLPERDVELGAHARHPLGAEDRPRAHVRC